MAAAHPAATAHPGVVPPVVPAGAAPVRSPARPRSTLPDHRPPPAASAAAALPPPLLAPRSPLGAPPATSTMPDARAVPSPAASEAAAHLGVVARLPLPAPVLRHPPRPLELRQSARPPVLAARCPTIARHPPLGVPPAASAAVAHPATATRPPPDAGARATRPSLCSVRPSP